MVSQHALQVVSQHALQQVSGGGWYPSMPCRFSGPHPGGKLKGIWPRGSPGPHPRGKFEGDLARGGSQAHTQGEVEGDLARGSPGCTEADPPLTATAAGSTHPTEMHSCSLYFVVSPFVIPYLEKYANTFFIPRRNKRFLCCLSKGSMTKIYSPNLQSANVMMFSFSSNHTTPVTHSKANFPKHEETMKMKKVLAPAPQYI